MPPFTVRLSFRTISGVVLGIAPADDERACEIWAGPEVQEFFDHWHGTVGLAKASRLTRELLLPGQRISERIAEFELWHWRYDGPFPDVFEEVKRRVMRSEHTASLFEFLSVEK